MGERVSYDGTDIEIYNADDELIWDNDRRPIQLLDEDAWLMISDLEIEMPDFLKSNAHVYTNENIGGFDFEACVSYATLLPQEWGPGESSPRTLDDIVLGTVPSGVNYLDVRVTLARTDDPTNFLGVAVPNLVPANETFLPGGSLDLELAPLWRRAAWIGLDGTNVILRRWQSTAPQAAGSPYYWGISSTGTSATDYGWSAPITNYGNLVAVLASSAPSITGTGKHRSTGICSVTDTTNFRSLWEGTAVIRPGYIDGV